MYNTVFGHLLSAQKGVSDLWGPLQILFSSHVSAGETFTGGQAAIATPGTGPLFAVRILKLPLRRKRPDAGIVPIKRNICAGKVPRCSLSFFKKFIIIIIQYERGGGGGSHDIISVI